MVGAQGLPGVAGERRDERLCGSRPREAYSAAPPAQAPGAPHPPFASA